MQTKVPKRNRFMAGIKRRLLTKNQLALIRAELVRDINYGDMVEKFLKSPEWRAIISPWLRAKRNDMLSAMANFRHTHPEDQSGYFEAGQIRAVFEFRHMLNEAITKRGVAIQKLESLQQKSESNNG